MLKRCLLIGFLFLVCEIGGAQVSNPAWGEAFVQDHVTRFDVTMDPADLTWLLAQENLESDDYKEASFIYTDSEGNTHQYTGVGIRLRGNTSRYAQKKSFKIDMNEFGGTEDFYDLGKLNFKGSHNDPSLLRERLAYYYMREMGGAAPRVNNIELYINGEYRGLYVNIEQINKDFLKLRFDEKSGNLYKCSYGASLRLSDDVWNNSVFELETNETANDRSDLIELIDVLNNTSTEDFKTEIEKVLDVDHLLKYLAVEVLTGHWDGYSFNKNNFYLYHNQDLDKFQMIMYDCDNTFGIDWFGVDWALRDVYNWANQDEDRPMFWRVLDVPEFREQFTSNLYFLINGEFNESIFPWIDELIEQNKPFALADNYRTLDYGFDSAAYVASATTAFGAHVKYGIEPFISQRKNNAKPQLDWPQGIEETKNGENQFYWFSNQNKLSIKARKSVSENTIVSVYSVEGKLVNQQLLGTSVRNVELELNSGVYVVSIKSAGFEEAFRVVVL